MGCRVALAGRLSFFGGDWAVFGRKKGGRGVSNTEFRTPNFEIKERWDWFWLFAWPRSMRNFEIRCSVFDIRCLIPFAHARFQPCASHGYAVQGKFLYLSLVKGYNTFVWERP